MNEAEYQGSSVRVFRFGSFRAFQHDYFERKCPLFEPIFCGAMAIKTFVRITVPPLLPLKEEGRRVLKWQPKERRRAGFIYF